MAYFFGAACILQAILFLNFGVLQNKLSFKVTLDLVGMTGLILIIFAIVVYPTLGIVSGHTYPASPTFGLPCPTTIFTLGLLMLMDKKCPIAILIIPFVWSVIGFTAALQFGIYEDTGLLVSGLLALPMIVVKNKKM